MTRIAFLAGPMSSDPGYKTKFERAEAQLVSLGYLVINPVDRMPDFLQGEAAVHVTKAFIDVCDVVYFFENWEEGEWTKVEMNHARSIGKSIAFVRWDV